MIGWVDYRKDIAPLFDGGPGAVSQAYWAVLRISRLGQYSQYWNAERREAVNGPKYLYDDYPVRVICIPGSALASPNGKMDYVADGGTDNSMVRVFALRFSDVIRPGNIRTLCEDDTLIEINECEGSTLPAPPYTATNRYRILSSENVRGDNGRIEIIYLTARREHGVS